MAAIFARLDTAKAVPALAARNDLRFIDVQYFIALYGGVERQACSSGGMCQVDSMKLARE